MDKQYNDTHIETLKADQLLHKTYETYFFLSNIASRFPILHNHDFFEFFLVIDGYGLHNINGQIHELSPNMLVLLRPGDIHWIEKKQDQPFKYINIAISKKKFHTIFEYCGNAFEIERLLSPELPPVAIINDSEKYSFENEFYALNMFSSAQPELLYFRLYSLVLLFTGHCYHAMINISKDNNALPGWLDVLCNEMRKIENFTLGLHALYSLTDKSREHIGRSFKKHLSCTPTEFINQLRLRYAANLLANSSNNILDIMMESGFESTGYFYHLFSKQYGMTPNKYRKQHVFYHHY